MPGVIEWLLLVFVLHVVFSLILVAVEDMTWHNGTDTYFCY